MVPPSMKISSPPKPWYREPWPWLLMVGPALVIVAGVFTAWLAIQSDDGLVADDYYKQGLAINRTLERNDVARSGQYRARIHIDHASNMIRVELFALTALPQEIKLTLVNATRAGRDRIAVLTRSADGVYAGTLPDVPPGRWRVLLEDASGIWRLSGGWPSDADSFALDAGTS
jgi:uncharacterized protein